jgi:hypothetical protein
LRNQTQSPSCPVNSAKRTQSDSCGHASPSSVAGAAYSSRRLRLRIVMPCITAIQAMWASDGGAVIRNGFAEAGRRID